MGKYDYSIENPPRSCMDCEWHTVTYSPTKYYHTLHYDSCGHLRMPFAKMHIILLGEYRSLAKHDEDDLRKALPYECPYFDSSKIFWEIYGRIHMQVASFVYECLNHPETYEGYYVYTLPENISYLSEELPAALRLTYISVLDKDHDWFVVTYGDKEVLLSDVSPNDWHYPVPSTPV